MSEILRIARSFSSDISFYGKKQCKGENCKTNFEAYENCLLLFMKKIFQEIFEKY